MFLPGAGAATFYAETWTPCLAGLLTSSRTRGERRLCGGCFIHERALVVIATSVLECAMGTTVWVDEETREELRRLRSAFGPDSVDSTIRCLIARPPEDARFIFAAHRSAIEGIMRRHAVRRMVAFGSRARGDGGPGSDFDLAAEFDPSSGPPAIFSAAIDLRAELGLPVDLIELPNPTIGRVIEKEGVVFGG